MPEGMSEYWLGTDSQGRDLLSLLLFGMRTSLLIGFASVILAMPLGVVLGLIAGYAGGPLGSLIMWVADIQLSFPASLTALLVAGVVRATRPRNLHDVIALAGLIEATALARWPQYA